MPLIGWAYFESSFYKFHDTLSNFDNARAFCQSEGGDLTSISSRAENQFVYDLDPTPTASRWLGGLISRDPFRWSWMDGTPTIDFQTDASYAGCSPSVDCLFRKNEPNNKLAPEDCLSMGHPVNIFNPSGWNDANCTVLKFGVCERAGKSTR
jgi:hypothetical protein